jgi:Putative homoserine kinase type II (protein kinase fold)
MQTKRAQAAPFLFVTMAFCHTDGILMTDHGFDFHTLTPDVQLNAIESVGIYPQSGLLALNSYENRVAQFVADDGQRYVVKFYRPGRWSNAQILEEHAFCHELAQADIPVVAPIYREGTSLFTAEGFRLRCFPVSAAGVLKWIIGINLRRSAVTLAAYTKWARRPPSRNGQSSISTVIFISLVRY